MPPQLITTGNIGCQLHLQAGTELPMRHYIELVDGAARGKRVGITP